MRRLLSIMLTALLLLVPAAPVEAQTPPAGQQPAAQPGAPPGQQPPASGETKERNTTFDYFIAFFGAALVMVVVCYPSRRY
jgi:hypothetical protein